MVGVVAGPDGLDRFGELLSQLPADTGMAYVLLLPEEVPADPAPLAERTTMPVVPAVPGKRPRANHVYVAPASGLPVLRKRLFREDRIQQGPAPARADHFLASLAALEEKAIGIALADAGREGSAGLAAIRAAGGFTFAEEPWAESAVADLVLPLSTLATELVRIGQLVQEERLALPAQAAPATWVVPTDLERADAATAALRRIMVLLRNHSGVDFTLYKAGTTGRRILRRAVLNRLEGLEEYARFLRNNGKELTALHDDLLIGVTGFFRDPEAFAYLKQEVLPKLMAGAWQQPLRVWSVGCSTGQEAYSLAMLHAECADEPGHVPMQFFATDINEAYLRKAREGLYPKSIAHELSPERLQRFFTEEAGGYRVKKSLRESVIFARQNLMHDPPFSRMDLISCRNMMIYVQAAMQKRILAKFHYALKPDGALFLGASEGLGTSGDLFGPWAKESVGRTCKIYRRSPVPGPGVPIATTPLPNAARATLEPDHTRAAANVLRAADRVALEHFTPPAVLVNDALDVVEFRGDTSPFLRSGDGRAPFHLPGMVREELVAPLNRLVEQVRKRGKAARESKVLMQQPGGERLSVALEVVPFTQAEDPYFLVYFTQLGPHSGGLPGLEAYLAGAGREVGLETLLEKSREHLQAMEEQHAATNEELQASAEEVTSANEELQSINAELENSRQELQSVNEELSTINDELSLRNSELVRLTDDLFNLQVASQLAIVLLDRGLFIRRFSPEGAKRFHLASDDIGKHWSAVVHDLDVVELDPETGAATGQPGATASWTELAYKAITRVQERQAHVRDRKGRWYRLRIRPYMTQDNKVDGAVLVLVNVDLEKKAAEAEQAERERYRQLVQAMGMAVFTTDATGRIELYNAAAVQLWGRTPEAGERWSGALRLYHPDGTPMPHDQCPTALALRHGSTEQGQEVLLEQPDGTQLFVLAHPKVLLDEKGQVKGVVNLLVDLTARKRAERKSAQLAAIVSSSHDAIISKDLEGIIQTWNEGATELFGYTAEEAIGQPTTMLMPPDRVNEEPGILRRIKAGEVIDQYQAVRQHKDGHLLHILLTISPIRNEQGEIVGASKMARDIGAELAAMRAMRLSEQRYTDLFTTMDQGFCVIELDYDAQDQLVDWTYVEANPAFEKHSGMSNVVGKRASDLMPNLERSWLEMYDRVYQTGVGARCINAVSDVNRWIEVYAYPTGDQVHRQLAVLLTDVTERVRAERHMRQVAESLQREDRHKNQFLATLAHELRNPLAPLRSGLEVLQEGGNGAEVTGMMQRQVDQIVRLVDDLLDVSRLGTGKITLRKEPVALARIINEAAEAMAPVLREQGQQLLLMPPAESVFVEGDPARLTQVLSNLINNACKFSEDGSLIELRTAVHDGMAVIDVKDRGCGLSPEDLPRIFGLFNQAPAPAKLRNNAGLGIGLTLVRDLVQMHAGTVEAHSEGLGKGSTFTVKLPVMAEAPPAVSSNGKAPAPQVEGRKVLVVDDNLDAAQLLSMVLGRKGFQVRTAADGPAGIEAAEAFRPEVILLDIGLPGMSGYEVAQQLRAQEWAKGVLLVALTGWGQNEDREKSRQAGFDHHLVKPVQVGRILELMKEMAG